MTDEELAAISQSVDESMGEAEELLRRGHIMRSLDELTGLLNAGKYPNA